VAATAASSVPASPAGVSVEVEVGVGVEDAVAIDVAVESALGLSLHARSAAQAVSARIVFVTRGGSHAFAAS
jgi:hypothetical protein